MSVELYFCEVPTNSYANELCSVASGINLAKENCLSVSDLNLNQKLSICAEMLTRLKIAEKFQVPNYNIDIRRNKYGKPYVNNIPESFFNISHTENVFCVAISDSEIGVDIEKIKPQNINIAKRFFDKFEIDYILSNDNQDRAFGEIWTKKEAYIKCTGEGLSRVLSSFCVLAKEIDLKIRTISIGDYIISIYGEIDKVNVINLEYAELIEKCIKDLL